ncbi:hypothetical protein MMC13_002434 [Lambiella insularis]|nr:hypothetical protein [Lambiella insularis]
MQHSSLSSALAYAFQLPSRSNPFHQITRTLPLTRQHSSPWQQTSPFSTTSPAPARSNKNQPKPDRRVTLIRYFLQHPLTPRPLRLSRLRALRHWTIHRAWQLYQAQMRAAENLELERQYFSMRAACEELRLGCGDGGRLYRQAMVKKGVYGGLKADKGREGGVPIEYARAQTDSPPRDGWDHGWKR